MPHRTYNEEEVAALLERAADLQRQTGRRTARQPGLTLDELETIAAEAGLEPSLLRQAAQELDAPGRTLFDASTGTTATHVLVERWVPAAPSPEAWEDVVAELRHRFDSSLGAMMGMPGYGKGTAETIGRTVEWSHTSTSGVETRVMMRGHGEGTRLRLSQRVGWGSTLVESVAYGLLLALFAGAIGMPTTGSGWGALAVLLVTLLVAVPSILFLDKAWRQKKHRELETLGDHLSRIVAQSSAQTASAATVGEAQLDASAWEEATEQERSQAPRRRTRS